jgi:hypothetical protein
MEAQRVIEFAHPIVPHCAELSHQTIGGHGANLFRPSLGIEGEAGVEAR